MNPRGQPRVRWDDDMLRTLLEMRAKGHDLMACAKRIGVAHIVVRRKARELGIAQQMSRGPIPGVVVMAARGRP